MHFLINQTPSGHKLIDYGDDMSVLHAAMSKERGKSANITPTILNQRVVRETYLCDEYGRPIEEDSFLIALDDL